MMMYCNLLIQFSAIGCKYSWGKQQPDAASSCDAIVLILTLARRLLAQVRLNSHGWSAKLVMFCDSVCLIQLFSPTETYTQSKHEDYGVFRYAFTAEIHASSP